MGSCSGGRLGEDGNPTGDRTDSWFLILVLFALCFILAFFVSIEIFFVLGWFVNVSTSTLLKRTTSMVVFKADLESKVSKPYNMIDIN